MMFPAWVTRTVIHPLRQRTNRWERRVACIVDELEKSQWLTVAQLEHLQRKKLRALLSSAIKTPYYRRILTELNFSVGTIGLEHLCHLPTLSKMQIREHFTELRNPAFLDEELVATATGGSTGAPLRLFRSRHDEAYGSALKQRNFNWAGWHPGDYHVRLWGAPTDVNAATAHLKMRLQAFLYNRQILDAFAADDQLFDAAYGRFRTRPPKLLESYANILYEFSRYMEHRGYAPLHVGTVISSAGTLEHFQRNTIERAFGAEIFNRYGCREMGDIAHECSEHRGLHINMERFVVEVLSPDKAGNGELVITDLENHAFPLIRYRIGDLGKLADSLCACGRGLLLLEHVIGRSLDIILTPEGKRVSGVLFPHLFKDYANIIQGQVVQDRVDHVCIKLKLAEPTAKDFLIELDSKIRGILGCHMTLDIKVVEHIHVTPTGKFRPVISNIELPENETGTANLRGRT